MLLHSLLLVLHGELLFSLCAALCGLSRFAIISLMMREPVVLIVFSLPRGCQCPVSFRQGALVKIIISVALVSIMPQHSINRADKWTL